MANEPQNIFEEDDRPSKELRVLGAVCYLPFGFVLPYFLGKNHEEFVAFHVRQGASFFFVAFLTEFVLGPLPWLLYVVVSGITGYHAYLGERFMLGFIRKAVDAINKEDPKK